MSSLNPSMEAYSFIFDKWIICTTLSFFCFLALSFFLNYNQHIVSLTADITVGATTTTTNEAIMWLPPKDNATHPQEEEESLQIKKCDIFDGKWVYNPEGSTMYTPSQCPFLGPQVSCRRNGREENQYEKWRWEANECEIPRFNGRDMLERLRGKRVIIVGDSLNRNQFESLSCLLYTSIPSKSAIVNVKSDIYKIFTAKDYNCTVEFYWSPFLVELDGKILKLDTLDPSSAKWRGADVMIFNTGHWWAHTGKLQVWNLFQNEGKIFEHLEVEKAFEVAMRAWASWVDQYVDPAQTIVFFRSISPEHKGQQWCYNQTQPIQDESYIPIFPRKIVDIVETTIEEMKTPVRYLNITKLSQYRRDAHPSVYTAKKGNVLNKEQREQPKLFADCSHWCIPGVPDTWNSLVYASLILEESPDVM